MKMKSLYYLLVAGLLIFTLHSCGGDKKAEVEFSPAPGQTTPLRFENLSFELNDVKIGTIIKKKYRCKNYAKRPMRIVNVMHSCPSCMTVDFPKEPIMPDAIAEISVTYDTKGQQYRVEKILSVVMEGVEVPLALHLNFTLVE